jgi:hypothetical protein
MHPPLLATAIYIYSLAYTPVFLNTTLLTRIEVRVQRVKLKRQAADCGCLLNYLSVIGFFWFLFKKKSCPGGS